MESVLYVYLFICRQTYTTIARDLVENEQILLQTLGK